MEQIVKYLADRKMVETVAMVLVFIVAPAYLVMYLYSPTIFVEFEFIKLTMLLVGILEAGYVLQMLLFFVIHMLFTKYGRTMDEIVFLPAIALGISINLMIFLKIVTDNIIAICIIILVFSIIYEVLANIACEQEIKKEKKNK